MSLPFCNKFLSKLWRKVRQLTSLLRENERTLNCEDTGHKNILFPISTDDCIFKLREHPRRNDLLQMVSGDFTGWDKDAAEYGKVFERLLNALRTNRAKLPCRNKKRRPQSRTYASKIL